MKRVDERPGQTTCVCPLAKAPVQMPAYSSVEKYDPVLRWHCRMDLEPCVFPSLPNRRPGSLV